MAGIYLTSGQEDYIVANTSDSVYGSDATENVKITTGKTYTIDANTEKVTFANALSTYTFKQVGNQLEVADSSGVVATIGIDNDMNRISFNGSTNDNDFMSVAISTAVVGSVPIGTMSIATHNIGTEAAALTAIASDATELGTAISGILPALKITGNIDATGKDLSQFTAGINVDDTFTLTAKVADVTGLTVASTGTTSGGVTLTDLGSTAADLSHISTTGNGVLTVNMATGATLNNGTNLGSFGVTVNTGETLTATAAQLTGLAIDDASGTATVAVTALNATPTADLSKITTNSVTAAVADDVTFTGDLGTAVVTVADGKTLTTTAAIANGVTINHDGTESSQALTITDATTADFALEGSIAATIADLGVNLDAASYTGALTITTVSANEKGISTGTGGSDITLSTTAVATNITGNSGIDAITFGAASYTGSIALAAGSNTVTLVDGSNISGLTALTATSGTAALTTAGNVTMKDAQYDLFNTTGITATGNSDKIIITDAATIAANAAIETYELNVGGAIDIITDASAVDTNITSLDQANATVVTLNGGAATGTWNLQDTSTADKVIVTNGADISAVNSGAATTAEILDMATTGTITATMTAAQNNAFTTVNAADNNDTIAIKAGTYSSVTTDADISKYTLGEEVGNAITVVVGATSATDITSASSDDVITAEVAGTYTGTIDVADVAGDTLKVTANADISGATIDSDMDTLYIAANADVTMTKAQHAAFTTAINAETANTNTITIKAGADVDITADADMNYMIGDDTDGDTVSITDVTGTTSVNASTATDAVTVTLKTGAYTGTLKGEGTNDVLSVIDGTKISGATIGAAFDNLTIASGATVTMTSAQNDSFDGTLTVTGTNTITLSDASTATALANVENYVLGDFANSFTADATTVSVTGGTNNDVLTINDNLTTVVGGDGVDTIKIADDTNLSGDTFDTVEKLVVTVDAKSLTIDNADLGTFTDVTGVAGNAAEWLIVNNVADTAMTVDFSSAGTYTDIGGKLTDNDHSDNDTITSGNGNDEFTSGSTADTDTFVFADSLAKNGKDTLSGMTLTDGKDILNVKAFIGAAIDTTAANAALDSVNVSIADSLDYHTDTVNVIALNDIEDLAVTNFGTAADGKIQLANDGKAFVVADVAGDADNIMNLYYVTAGSDATGNAASVELVGVINENDLANVVENNFVTN